MTAYIEPVNTKLIQQNMRKDARIEQLERECASKDAMLREMRIAKLADYRKRMRRNRIVLENFGYLIYAVLAVGALWILCLAGEWALWRYLGVC